MIRKSSFIICFAFLFSLFAPTFAFAVEGVYQAPSKAIEDEAKKGYELESEDVSTFDAIMQFLREAESYVFIKEGSSPTYFFNTPNIPLNTQNMLQNINKGGWEGSFSTTEPTADATDALKRYGYTNPDYVYLGERPIIFLSLDQITSVYANIAVGVKLVISFVIGGIFSLFGGDFNAVVAQLNPQELSNLEYQNEDYVDFSDSYIDTLSNWLEKAWNKFPTSELEKIKIGDSGLDSITDGKQVGSEDGQLGGRDLLQKIIDKSGSNYIYVINALIEYAIQNADKFSDVEIPQTLQIRNMPYDLDSMSYESRNYMNNIEDPRVKMFGSTYLLGFVSVFAKQFMHVVSGAVLSTISALCFWASILNSICDMNLLKESGIDPTIAWTGTLGSFLIVVLLILTIFSIISRIKDALIGKSSITKVLVQGFGAAVLAGFVIAALATPQTLSNFISNTATRIMSLGATTMQTDDNFNQYYVEGQATQADISALRYWYVYHNCWAQYVTGHAITEDANTFDTSQLTSGQNEYRTLEGTYENPATLAQGKKINNWATILLDDLEKNDTGAALRATDHYLAPTITADAEEDGCPQFSVSKNPFYNGVDMYTNIPFAGIGLAVTFFVTTLLKLACFIGFLIDFMLLLVKFALGALNPERNYVKDSFVTMLKEVLKVVAYDIFLSFIIYASSYTFGAGYNLFATLALIITIVYIIYLFKHPNFILAPAILSPLKNKVEKAINIKKTTAKNSTSDKEKMRTLLGEIRTRNE